MIFSPSIPPKPLTELPEQLRNPGPILRIQLTRILAGVRPLVVFLTPGGLSWLVRGLLQSGEITLRRLSGSGLLVGHLGIIDRFLNP